MSDVRYPRGAPADIGHLTSDAQSPADYRHVGGGWTLLTVYHLELDLLTLTQRLEALRVIAV